MKFLTKLEQLKRLQADMERRIRKAQCNDNSYAHNDMLLCSLERELESINEQLSELATQTVIK